MDLEPRVRSTGLLVAGRPVLVMLSGGRDSTCLLEVAVRISGADVTCALHVNYGLREGADADEAHCRELCERLGVGLELHRPAGAPEGNLQAWAREERYAAAARAALERGGDIASGHTASDQVESVLYRLAASPGRRALLGMRARDGRVVRPLLECTREETAAHCEARGLPWRDDPSNLDPAFARTRVREALMEAMRSVHEGAEANVMRTLEVLRDEAAVLDEVVEGALRDAGWAGGPAPVQVARLSELAPAVRRLAVQRMADAAYPDRAPAIGMRAAEILSLAASGGTSSLDLGSGLRAVVSYGELRFEKGSDPNRNELAISSQKGSDPNCNELAISSRKGSDPNRNELAISSQKGSDPLVVPGRVAWGGGVVSAEVGDFEIADGVLDAVAVGEVVEVRSWEDGDRMRPLGLGGTKSLQDLFTDRKVPRERRHELPVVIARGEIAWIPGVATGEAFRVTEATGARVRLRFGEA